MLRRIKNLVTRVVGSWRGEARPKKRRKNRRSRPVGQNVGSDTKETRSNGEDSSLDERPPRKRLRLQWEASKVENDKGASEALQQRVSKLEEMLQVHERPFRKGEGGEKVREKSRKAKDVAKGMAKGTSSRNLHRRRHSKDSSSSSIESDKSGSHGM